jgi:hypothetical protein
MKVVINTCFGGFGLSHKAMLRYIELSGHTAYPEQGDFNMWTYWIVPAEQRPKEIEDWHKAPLAERKAYNEAYRKASVYDHDIKRDDPILIRVVEELGAEANGLCAELKVVEIPDGVRWEISEYDGREHIAEQHQTWG